ncbi:MAG: pilus assembly PilX N-terminal domain-containing protein [Nitrospinae bacterium]|nr:pilus assembly PilX N-terminal domain-containing protein [Nitrospinota bacterium]
MKKNKFSLNDAFRTTKSGESGIALVTALLVMFVLTLLATAAIMTTGTDVKIGSNYKATQDLFYVADAGLEAGRNFLSSNFNTTTGWNTYLTNGNNPVAAGDTVKGTNITGYLSSNVVGRGTFRISVLDDNDGDGSYTADVNKKVFLTSKGTVTTGGTTAMKTLEEYFEFNQNYSTYGGKDLTGGNTGVATGEAAWSN